MINFLMHCFSTRCSNETRKNVICISMACTHYFEQKCTVLYFGLHLFGMSQTNANILFCSLFADILLRRSCVLFELIASCFFHHSGLLGVQGESGEET